VPQEIREIAGEGLPNQARTELPPQHAKTARAGDPGLNWGPACAPQVFLFLTPGLLRPGVCVLGVERDNYVYLTKSDNF
jgi:hypothetical protein